MSRPLRVWIPGGIYHLTIRGNNRQAIFVDSLDYQQYLLELRQCRDHEPHRLLAFALMPNHVHLVVESLPQGSLSRAMQRIGTGYSRYFNDRHGRVGHVYQGRFYSNHVDRESYLFEVTRYVHLNPVRAQLAQGPGDYPWTSYRSYLGLEADLVGLVDADSILNLFGSTRMEQRERYKGFVEELLAKEEAMRRWLRHLNRNKLIPPTRWLKSDSHFAKQLR